MAEEVSKRSFGGESEAGFVSVVPLVDRAQTESAGPTSEQFAEFKEQVRHWIGVLGLSDWRVTIRFEPSDSRATCRCAQRDHVATICLSTTWDAKPSDEEIKHSALHETLHLLLADLRFHALARSTLEYDVDLAEHAAIWRIQQALLGPAG